MPQRSRYLRADGPQIRKKREEGGTSLGRFAYEIQIDPGYLSRIEQGHRNPSPEVTARIAMRLGVQVSDITAPVEQAAS